MFLVGLVGLTVRRFVHFHGNGVEINRINFPINMFRSPVSVHIYSVSIDGRQILNNGLPRPKPGLKFDNGLKRCVSRIIDARASDV